MVSVLIPVYNYDVCPLVIALNEQLTAFNGAELILCDDDSDLEFQEKNKALSKEFSQVRYLQNSENKGRSATRNRLADAACNEILIFLDSDTLPCSADFVQNYVSAFSPGAVLFGGIKYSDNPPEDANSYLRWFYGKQREEISPEIRQTQGNRLFMTGNFCVAKSVFKTIRFNENLRQYGHEDTLFAFDLARNQHVVKHLDNPAYHIGLESCRLFLEKTLVAVKNLHVISEMENYAEILDSVRLWRVYRKLKIFRPIFKLMFFLTKHFFEKNLSGTKPKLLYFDLYKLFALAERCL